MSVNVSVTFTSGTGTVEATLFRDGNQIADSKIETSGSIPFDDAQSNDDISVSGVTTGTATVKIDAGTHPATPQSYPAGPFFGDFRIL